MNARKKRDPELEKLIILTDCCHNHIEEYKQIKEKQQILQEVADILKTPDKLDSLSLVERKEIAQKQISEFNKKMEEYKQQIDEDSVQKELLEHIIKLSRSFGNHLFVYIEVPGMPKTNNGTEQFFRETKTRLRRITGRQNNNKPILFHGEYIVYTVNGYTEEQIIELFTNVTYEEFRKEREHWLKKLEPSRQGIRFKKNPDDYLANLKTQWENSCH